MRKQNSLSFDVVMKSFFTREDRCADFLNAALFDGRQIAKPQNIDFLDTDCTSIRAVHDRFFIQGKRQRDKFISLLLDRDEMVLIGLELQSWVDPTMAGRMLDYVCDTLRKFGKIHRIISVVAYGGSGKWTASTSLKGMDKPIGDPMIDDLLVDAEYILIDFKNIDVEKLRVREVKEAIEGIQRIYKGMDVLMEGKKRISKDAAMVIAAVTGEISIMKKVWESEEEEIMVCETFEAWTRESEERGIEKGIDIGIDKGIEIGKAEGKEEGRIEGKLEGERSIFINLIEQRFGKLSEGLKEQLKGCSDKAFERLIERFYQLNDETEIRKILLS